MFLKEYKPVSGCICLTQFKWASKNAHSRDVSKKALLSCVIVRSQQPSSADKWLTSMDVSNSIMVPFSWDFIWFKGEKKKKEGKAPVFGYKHLSQLFLCIDALCFSSTNVFLFFFISTHSCQQIVQFSCLWCGCLSKVLDVKINTERFVTVTASSLFMQTLVYHNFLNSHHHHCAGMLGNHSNPKAMNVIAEVNSVK